MLKSLYVDSNVGVPGIFAVNQVDSRKWIERIKLMSDKSEVIKLIGKYTGDKEMTPEYGKSNAKTVVLHIHLW